jgi:alpha-glucosidase (family GH31 glycosyl hydrolase)/DUF1680 family protein
MPTRFLTTLLVTASCLAVLARGTPAPAQGGDQILDGIGETGLVARYILDATTEDASRHQFHAASRGSSAFVDDDQFRTALLLTGDGGHLQLPGEALTGEDTLSVTGWVFLPTGASGPFFDFGQSGGTRFAAVANPAGFRASVLVDGQARGETPGAPFLENRWVHLAVVLDPAGRTLTTYVDGAKAAQVTDVTATATAVVHQTARNANRLFIGRSQDEAAPTLHARLRDVRVYRVALSEAQIATIRRNALAGRPATPDRPPPPPEISTAAIPLESPLASRLSHVPDITVATLAGTLPHLPAAVPARYRDQAHGPDVRVIWPSPVDARDVAKPGTYTVTGRVPGTPFAPKATVIVKAPVGTLTPPERLVEPFALADVTLDRDTNGRETPFIRNRDTFVRGLAASNPDTFLYNFRDAFGQPQPAGATPLEGWDNQTTRLRGHASGHYLSAMAQAYAGASDEALRATLLRKMTYVIDTLHDLSRKSGRPATPGGPSVADPTGVPPAARRAGYDSNLRTGAIRTDYWNWGVGFISAYPPDQFVMLEKGATYGTQDTQIWAPYYTLHKILAGLLDCYEVAGNQKALEIARGMGTWTHARLNALPPETRTAMWGRYIAGEYGGMNEVMARLFRLTGDRRFLDTAQLFDNTTVFFGNAAREHGLARNVDTIRGRHANQHIPQITGALETFRATKDLPYWLVASNFWDIVNRSYTYSIGGVAGARTPNNAECFTAQPDTLWQNGFAAAGQNETCATYNLLKLDRQLFMYQQTAKYMDHYEQALYNHILASVAEADAGNTYHVPLNPGAQKRFGNADMHGFTCCNGTALESHTKLQDSIYFRSADRRALYVNLFIPSTLTWRERNVVVEQRTDFPYADTTTLTVKGHGQFDLKVRVPRWATRGFVVRINGRATPAAATPGTYLTLARTWRDGDTIAIRMPFGFELSPVVDQPNVASLFYGPILLAAEEAGPRTDWRQVRLDARDPGRSITGDPTTLRFSADGVAFKPFYESYGRYSVYLHVVPATGAAQASASASTAGAITTAGQPARLDVRSAGPHSVRVTLTPLSVTGRLPDNPAVAARPYPAPVLSLRALPAPVTKKVGALAVEVRPNPLTVRVTGAAGRLVQALTFEANGTLSFALDDQPVLGLGEGGPLPDKDRPWREQPVQFDRRGRLDPMQPRWQADMYGSRNPVALLMGTKGWGLFVATPWGQVDLRGTDRGVFLPWRPTDADRVPQNERNQQQALAKGLPPPEGVVPGLFDLFVVDAADPAAAMQDLSRITGPAAMPPLWALGYMQSHRTLETDAQMVGIADTFRQKRLPLDALIYLGTGFTPRGWNTRQPSFQFNPEVFTRDPAAVIADLHARHVKVVVHTVPWDRDRLPALDAARRARYWQEHVPLVKAGVDAFWPDEGDWFNLHERIARHRLYYEGPLQTTPDVRPWSLQRNGYPGIAQWGGWVWSGDTESAWKTLEAQIAVGLNYSLSIGPYWGSDIGGFYANDELTGELYARWFQFAAFCGSFRSHGRTWWTRLPWGWGLSEMGPREHNNTNAPIPPDDRRNILASELNNPAIEPIARRYAELRYRLLPYTYTLAWEARDRGLPLMRALWLHYPGDPRVRGLATEYLWGRDLLVAPVFTKGATSRDVYLPAGDWYDWWTGEKLAGGRTVTRPVDLATMPLYARAGAIVPLDPVRQYTAQAVTGPTTLKVYTGADGAFTLYADDGVSQRYLQGRGSWIRMTWNDRGRQLTLEPGAPAGATDVVASRTFRVELHPTGAAKDVAYGGKRVIVRF